MWQLKYTVFFLCIIVADGKPKVAFTAALSKDTSVWYHHAVRYDRVITNIGGAYHPWTGHFTVPYSGIYLISCTAMSEAHIESYLDIVKNRRVLTTLFSNRNTHPQSAQTLILYLKKNDRIWVWGRYKHQVLNGNENFNVFSGVLL